MHDCTYRTAHCIHTHFYNILCISSLLAGTWAEPALYLFTRLSPQLLFLCVLKRFLFFLKHTCDHIFTQKTQTLAARHCQHLSISCGSRQGRKRRGEVDVRCDISGLFSHRFQVCNEAAVLSAAAARVLLGAGEWRTMRCGCAKAACWLCTRVLPDWTRALLIPSPFSIAALLWTFCISHTLRDIFFLLSCARVPHGLL